MYVSFHWCGWLFYLVLWPCFYKPKSSLSKVYILCQSGRLFIKKSIACVINNWNKKLVCASEDVAFSVPHKYMCSFTFQQSRLAYSVVLRHVRVWSYLKPHNSHCVHAYDYSCITVISKSFRTFIRSFHFLNGKSRSFILYDLSAFFRPFISLRFVNV